MAGHQMHAVEDTENDVERKGEHADAGTPVDGLLRTGQRSTGTNPRDGEQGGFDEQNEECQLRAP